MSQSNYPVSINSTPDDATFTVKDRNGQVLHSGVTPETIILKSGAGFFKAGVYTISVEKDGFMTGTHTLKSTVDGWYFGNILLGGIAGMLVVDPLTGAMYRLPEIVNVPLATEVSSTAKAELTVVSINSLSEAERANLIPMQ